MFLGMQFTPEAGAPLPRQSLADIKQAETLRHPSLQIDLRPAIAAFKEVCQDDASLLSQCFCSFFAGDFHVD